jgi:hypothetical protein
MKDLIARVLQSCSILSFGYLLFCSQALAQEFETVPDMGGALFTERHGEQLSLELGCPDKREPCVGRVSWGARQCFGSGRVRRTSARLPDAGKLVILERLERKGSCESNYRCEIVLERGWGSYRRICDGKEVTSGRFDKGRNIELFGDRVAKSEFYRDPSAGLVAARIPPPPPSLKDNDSAYKDRFKAIPAPLLSMVRAGKPAPLDRYELRDVLDAVVAIDSQNWSFNTYIPGSLTEVRADSDGAGVNAHATITISPFSGHDWVRRSVSVRLLNGYPECIKYWNSTSCSVNYDLQAFPNADPNLTAEQSRCIAITTGQYSAALPRQCVVMHPRKDVCLEESPQEFEQRDYRQITNSCDKDFEVVLSCPVLRARLSLPAKSTIPAPGFSVLNCRLQRLPRG